MSKKSGEALSTTGLKGNQKQGRPKVYNLLEMIAIYLRVIEVQERYKFKYRTEAIRHLQSVGELPKSPGVNLGRYLTPAYLNPEIKKALRNAPDRVGIVSLIPMPKQNHRKNKGV